MASVRRTTEECARLKIEQLTLYCLSSENWKRPQPELDFLMHLLEQYMIEERSTIMDNNIRVRMIGRRDGIPEQVLRELDKTVEMSQANTGLRLYLAINYGGRAEIVDAVRAIGEQIQAGKLQPADVDEQTIADQLYTAGAATPTCWSARPARCGSATSCCGRSATPRSGSPTSAGPSSTKPTCTRRFAPSPAASAASADSRPSQTFGEPLLALLRGSSSAPSSSPR